MSFPQVPEIFIDPAYSSTEVLRVGGGMFFFRGRRNEDGKPVLAFSTAADAVEQVELLEREYALREELELPWAARPLALLRHQNRLSLILEDPGGTPLDLFPPGTLAVADCLRVAIGVSSSLSRLHAKGLVHKDVKPGNILTDPMSGAASLTGFGIATRFPRERQGHLPLEAVSGTLSYMAPEQTGRMNRSVDSRSDLYALGTVLYELLTGSVPFSAEDPLDLIHSHIARTPVPPVEREGSRRVPKAISDIVMKLLAKPAEERYQTARGLEADLRRCLSEWEERGVVEPFALAAHDVPDRLLIPEKLYGREKEVRALLAAFERVARGGSVELILVSGYAGVGKSSLVQELEKESLPCRGFFASGKFEQYKRDIPYATLAQACKSLIRQVLVKPDEEADRWRRAIQAALDPNGRVLSDIIPDLELFLGKQPGIPELPPQESQNRFRTVVSQFLGAFARPEHPLVLFLDDLQWLDLATLEFLEHVLTRAALGHLLVVGGYRDNEVSPAHPLMLTLSAIRRTGAQVHDITLAPLVLKDVGELVVDILRIPRERAEPLARLIHEKTGGNPFFTLQFLAALHEEGLIAFDPHEEAWVWNIERIRSKGYTDNVAALMAGKLARLARRDQEALKALACLGVRGEAEVLARVLGVAEERARADLEAAQRAGFLLADGEGYAFAHDRIQEAAYSLVPPEARAAEHLRIGRILLQGRTADGSDDLVFELASHLNRGLPLIGDPRERESVRRLNFQAGMRAKAATAYAAARDHMALAVELLPENAWETRYVEAFSAHLELSEDEYLASRFERADELFNAILEKSRDDLDRAKVYDLRAKLYQVSGRFEDGVRSGLEALRVFGIDLPEKKEDIQAAIGAELAGIAARLAGRRIAALADAREIEDPRTRAILSLLVDTFAPSFFANPHLFALGVLKAVNLSLDSGKMVLTPYIYVSYALLLSGPFRDIPSAIAFSRLAIDLNERLGGAVLRGALLSTYNGSVLYWENSFASCRAFFERGFVASLNVGDFVHAGYNAVLGTWGEIDAGVPIEEFRTIVGKYRDFAVRNRQDVIFQVIRVVGQFLACMRGDTADTATFDDGSFEEERSLEVFRTARHAQGFAFYHVLKQASEFHFGRYENAWTHGVQAQAALPAMSGLSIAYMHHYYHALSAAALYSGAGAERQAELQKILDGCLGELKFAAGLRPENFQDRHDLVAAEKARIEGRDIEAMRLYERAIASARDNGMLPHEALACELAGRFYSMSGLAKNAMAHLKDAHAGFRRWGALAKVRHIEKAHPGLEPQEATAATATIGAPVGRLDLRDAIKASQAVSGEIVLSRLVKRVMGVVIDNAGADRGLLLFPKGEGFVIGAEATLGPEGVDVRLDGGPIAQGRLSEAVFRYALRTRESVILDDTSVPGLFSEDGYVKEGGSRSILCLPLLNQSRIAGVLYLENSLAPGAFTPGRVAMLNILASQAVISLENARLFAELAEERSRLQAVIRQVPAGLLIGEAPSGRISVMNDRVESILKFPFLPAGSFEGYGKYPIFHPEGRRCSPEELPLARSIRSGETVIGEELLILREGGAKGWIEVSSTPVRDAEGRITAGVAIFQDITERKAREAALQASEERFSKSFHNNPTPMAILRSRDWIFIDANESFQRLLGYRRDELLDNFSMGLGTWFMDLLETASRRLASGHAFRDEEVFATAKSGDPRTLLISIDTIDIASEKCFLSTFVDLTERKRVDEQLRQSQKMDAIGSLAGGVAHDFNNLLTAINGYSEMVLMGMEASDHDYEYVRSIRASGERAAGLTRKLLAFSRKETVQARVLSLNAIVADMEGMLRRLIEENVKLETVLQTDAGSISADRGQVEQILLNLVVNARDAMPEGGRLLVETFNATVEVPPRDALLTPAPGAYVVLSVKDEGIGMTQAVKDKLFEPFFTTKEAGKGTGLGLAVVYGIIKQRGGGIAVDSEPGKGTTFQIFFPSIEGRALALEPPAWERKESFRGNEKVLVVEDEEEVLRFVRQALESQGYGVMSARNGREALQVLGQEERIDIVVTDVIMPDMGGRELAAQIREGNASLPILYTSGYSKGQDALRELKNGEYLLSKPFGPSDLARKVREILDQYLI